MADNDGQDTEAGDSRFTTEREGEFVVFLIGMRINAFWKVHRWFPVVLIAPRMVRELLADPDSGLLGSRTVVGPGVRQIGFIQYWDSFDSLREYARDRDRLHLPAWRDYYDSESTGNTAVGIWHETYRVRANECESVYNNIPPHGLASSEGTDVVPASGHRETAAGRLNQTDGTDGPAPVDSDRFTL